VARDLEEELAARPGSFLPAMYGDKPRKWSATLEGEERRRVAINAMTRMRMLTEAGELDMDFKKPPEEAPPGLRPWFEATRTGGPLPRVFFGHWAALGLRVTNSVVGLDSGCAWGGWLTAYRLDDGAIFQERSELAGRRAPD
jgi:bis(5'-nucleosyl)-tetraphosphatase (symmetrical)